MTSSIGAYHVVYAEELTLTPSVSIGDGFAVALAADGTLWSWGQNTSGQLGVDTGADTVQTTPVCVSKTKKFSSVCAGAAHVLALSEDGTVWVWGENGSGQLGLGDTADRAVPTQLPSFSSSPVEQIAAGGYTSFARTEDGRVWAWGSNQTSMLGDPTLNTLTLADEPIQISALSDVFVNRICIGEVTAAAIASDGSVWLWGANDSMQAGVSASSEDVKVPTKKTFSEIYQAIDVVFGDTHTSFLCNNGSVISFGLNRYGQFGTGVTESSVTTTAKKTAKFYSGTIISSIASGSAHMMALTTFGKVYTWGSDRDGQLGADPEQTTLPTELVFSSEDYAISIAAGYENSAMIDSKGHVYMWGSNTSGQLGNGTSVSSDVPVAVKGEGGVGSLYLGLTDETFEMNTYITATATIPAPTFQISVPSAIGFEVLEQKSDTAEDKIATAEIEVGASNIQYFFGKRIVVRVSPFERDAFELVGENDSLLPYSIYNSTDGDDALSPHDVFAQFSDEGSVKGRIEIDQSKIEQTDTYRGRLLFAVSVEDAS